MALFFFRCAPLALTLGLFLGGCVAGDTQTRRAEALPSVADRLESDVRVLSERYAQRSANNRDQLNDSGVWIGQRFASMGYEVDTEPVPTAVGPKGFNVIAEITGTLHPEQIVVIGAHYDTELHTPGADDNASGVAVMLELAARFVQAPQARTIRWIAYTNEEGSNSAGGAMGSYTNATNSKAKNEQIVAMLSLEMLGYFSDEPGSQRYPFPAEMANQLGMDLPTVGNYIGVVGRLVDRPLLEQVASAMSGAGTIPVTQAAIPPLVTAIYRSDHANYWLRGYPAAMITDTSEYRNPHYHRSTDTADTLNYVRMSAAADALEAAARSLAND